MRMCDNCEVTLAGDNRYNLCNDCNEARIDEENAIYNAEGESYDKRTYGPLDVDEPLVSDDDWIAIVEDKVFRVNKDTEFHDLRDSWECHKDWRAIAAMRYGTDEETNVGRWCIVSTNTSGYHRSVLVMATNLRDAIKDGLEVTEYVHNREMRSKV